MQERTMQDTLPKEYDHQAVEEKWRSKTYDDIYRFDWESEKPQYIIDTPPPYPTGNLHIGNSLNWCYIDFVARYKRMQGYNVMFPQGWDCHGLPTEVKVEETHGITRNQIPRSEFRDLCRELTARDHQESDPPVRVSRPLQGVNLEKHKKNEGYHEPARIFHRLGLRVRDDGSEILQHDPEVVRADVC
jgi:isoleucyl-tRNA synthetase